VQINKSSATLMSYASYAVFEATWRICNEIHAPT